MQRIHEQGIEGVKVALVHVSVQHKNKENNIARLLNINEKAAREGARIIVNPELATSGYVFNNRLDIAPWTETIPGPTTEAFGQISKKFGTYICIGLAEVDTKTGIFYNAAAVIGPEGLVVGKHRKIAPAFRENLWAAEGNLPPLVVQTEYGKLGVAICADAYSYKPVRAAALQGARLLLVPVNWPSDYNNPEKYWRARALENGIYVLICNRTGLDSGMDCSSGESFIINNRGEVVENMISADDRIIYSILPLNMGKFISSAQDILAQRRPHCYTNISLATWSHSSSDFLLGLPEAIDCTVATVQYRPILENNELNKSKMLELIDKSVAMVEVMGGKVDLLVFPELSITGIISGYPAAERLSEEIPGPTSQSFVNKAQEKDVFIVIGMAERKAGKIYNSSVLISPNGIEGVYRKVHLSSRDKGWAEEGDSFPTFDLPFGRIGMLLGYDLMFPESTECLAKIGTDLLCVPSIWEDPKSQFMWEARAAEQMHLAIANQWGYGVESCALGKSAIYSYALDPDQRHTVKSPAKNDNINIMRLKMKDTRAKNFVEKIDYDVLLDLGGEVRCSDKS
ncbi:MAG: carbon-nitrogen hydrolase family protein [Syntrophomonadaceae bacterium]|nr:carbon-nitrogen hydrolase family protein [Syntrophomonadaceae bacterium]